MSEYKQPISLVDFEIAIKDTSDNELLKIKNNLLVSIQRLKDSNKLMANLMNKELHNKQKNKIIIDDDEFNIPTDDDIKIYTDSINENNLVIENQSKRCGIINDELKIRNLSSKNDNDIAATATFDAHKHSLPDLMPNSIPISTDNDDSSLY